MDKMVRMMGKMDELKGVVGGKIVEVKKDFKNMYITKCFRWELQWKNQLE